MNRLLRILRIIWLFQQKIIFPSLAISLIFTAIGQMTYEDIKLGNFGLFYLTVSLIYHLFIYEYANPGDYYLYQNLGFTRLSLWLSTFSIGFIVFLITSIL